MLLAGTCTDFIWPPIFISQIVAIPLWFKLSAKIGKHRATMVAIFWYALLRVSFGNSAPQTWFDAFELSKILSFLPDSWLAGMARSSTVSPRANSRSS